MRRIAMIRPAMRIFGAPPNSSSLKRRKRDREYPTGVCRTKIVGIKHVPRFFKLGELLPAHFNLLAGVF